MPTELRRIVFTGEELRVALDNYLMRKGTPLPPGVIAGVRMTGADGGSVVFDIRDTWDGISNPVEIASRHVGAALIRYCKICKIPLPKDAGKSLSISGDNLALDIRSGRSQAPTVTNIGVDDGEAERS